MEIVLQLELEKDHFDTVTYSFPMQEAAYFMGLLQQGVKHEGVMFVMEDHYFDTETKRVYVNCITEKEAQRKLDEAKANMFKGVSPEFMRRLGPAFETDDGCGGCGGCGGGNLN